MLLRTALITGLASIASLPFPARLANADGVVLRSAVLVPTPVPPVSVGENDAVVRVRLVEELQKPGSVASVSLAAGSKEVFVVEVKRSALSARVLAAAFAARAHLADKRSKYSKANIVVYISTTLSPRNLSRDEQLKFERLVAQLAAHPSGFIEISGA